MTSVKPAVIKIQGKGEAVTEFILFLMIFAYLCLIYAVMTSIASSNFGSKLEGANDEI